MSIDRVFARGMRLDASLGIDDWEHKTRQLIEVDVEVAADTAALIATGDLAQGVDFTTLVKVVRDTVASGHIDLAETLADRIARNVLDRTVALLAIVEVRKFAPAGAAAAHFGVRVTRAKAGATPRPSGDYSNGLS